MKLLAYHCYPGVPGGCYREYTAEELTDPKKLEHVFDYCQILEAYITADGWYFLIAHYGFEKLYEIDRAIGWFDEDTLEEYIVRVCDQIQMLEKLRLTPQQAAQFNARANALCQKASAELGADYLIQKQDAWF